jgi:hypothetical protein
MDTVVTVLPRFERIQRLEVAYKDNRDHERWQASSFHFSDNHERVRVWGRLSPSLNICRLPTREFSSVRLLDAQ